MKKKLISVLALFAVILPLFSGLAFAVEPQSVKPIELAPVTVEAENKTYNYYQELEKQAYIQVSELTGIPLPRVQDYYKTVVFPMYKGTLDAEVGGQEEKCGTIFEQGGGFFYNDAGGPEVSFGFSVSLEAIVNFPFSIGISVGMVGGTGAGKYVPAPDRVNPYKLYVKKEVEITPVGIYRVPSPNAPVDNSCPLAYTMHSYEVITSTPYCRIVCDE